MTEAEWEACGDDQAMLAALRPADDTERGTPRPEVSDRKLWLFDAARCRVAFAPMFRSYELGIGAMEGMADGNLPTATAHAILSDFGTIPENAWEAVAGLVASPPRKGDPLAAALLLDILGNPFRPVTLDPAWLAWNGGTIPVLARAVYEERELPSGHLDATRLALLADMLEDAGCSDTQVLEHLRGHGPHVRGCWVVDILLEKA